MMRTCFTLLAVAALGGAVVRAQDPDRDGDGLSDFHELHKYGTDPDSKDSDGDGIPDGEWDERREYSYTIRTVVRVIPPCGRGDLCDDYQDARIRRDTAEYVELEVIHYPLATAGERIEGRADWRRGAAKLKEYLKPRINTNWDAKMRRDLLAELKEEGIDVAGLTDKEVAERISGWFVTSYQSFHMFNALHVHYPRGKVAVLPGRKANFDRQQQWTFEQQFERELLGKEMYYHKTRGTCTSSAMALTTVMRAAGLPTRMILSIPFVDGSDPDQVAAVRKNLRHHQVRDEVLRGISKLANAFASHTFNEVFVGGRWRRLNYNRLGQPILDRGLFGLTTHVHTFNDLSEWGLQPTWGKWSARGSWSPEFVHNNPYAMVELSDSFGAHAAIPNPPVSHKGLTSLTINKVYWFDSPDRPASIGADAVQRDGSGHLLMHVATDIDDWERAAEIYAVLDKDFVLIAKGLPEIAVHARRGYWGHEFYLQIDPGDLALMKEGVDYALHARNKGDGPKWKIAPGVTLARGAPAAAAGKPREHRRLTITRAYWADSPAAAKWIADALAGQPGALMLHVDEWFAGGDGDQLEAFTRAADLDFRLVAKGRPPLRAAARVGCCSSSNGEYREIIVDVPPGELAKMKRGVAYRIEPVNDNADYRWAVAADVTIKR